jgi:hypothetical protein
MNNPNDKATNGQTFAIFCIARFDVRNSNLTKAQAGSLIDRLKTGDRDAAIAEIAALPNAVKKGEPAKPKEDWKALYNAAHNAGMVAANKTIPEPMVVNTHESPPVLGHTPIVAQTVVMSGVCGFAYVNVRPANGGFAKWLVDNKLARKGGAYGGSGVSIWVHQFNQSMELKEAYAHAFAETVRAKGIDAYAGSRMD